MQTNYTADNMDGVDHTTSNDNSSNCCYLWSTHGQSYMNRNKRLTAKPDDQSDLFYVEVVPQDTLQLVNNNTEKKDTNGGKKGRTIVYVTIATERRKRQGFNSIIRQSGSSFTNDSNGSYNDNGNNDSNSNRKIREHNKIYLSCGEPSRITDSCPCTYNRSGNMSNKEIFQMIYCEDDGTYIFKSWNGYYLHYHESTNNIAFTRCKLQIDGLPPEKGRWDLRDNAFEKGTRSRWTAATGVLNYIYG